MTDEAAKGEYASVDGTELATLIAAKLCHDFISPSGAIVSGLDLLRDPSAKDMRDDAIALIESSAARMVALVQFARVAFGAATTAERFSGDDLKPLALGVLDGGRATIDWRIEGGSTFSKPQARAILNLAYMTVGALPTGGVATLSARQDGDDLVLEGLAEGARARLKPEAQQGLVGAALTDGLAGQWVQPYWLWLTAREAGGDLAVNATEGCVTLTARLPA
jgi:histidine phosphotransferase ChpT